MVLSPDMWPKPGAPAPTAAEPLVVPSGQSPRASLRWCCGWSPHSSQFLRVPTCVYLKGNLVFQMLEESVYELVVKQLRQHQNTMEDKFIVCLSRATKNFARLADRWGGLPCPPTCWGGS